MNKSQQDKFFQLNHYRLFYNMTPLNYSDGIRSLANIYSPAIFRNIIKNDNLSTVEKRITKYKECILSSKRKLRFDDFLKSVYSEMNKNYRNEYIYKNAIINKLLFGKYSLNTTTLLNEFRIGKSIADTVLINGEVKVFEIKTDLDSLSRLDTQLLNYKKAVEKIYIVTNTKHIKGIFERYCDSNYGLIELTSRKTLKVHKDATSDKSSFDRSTIFKLLRKEEYQSIVKNEFNFIPDVPNTKIFRECYKKALDINIIKFQKLAFEQIKSRKIDQPQLLINQKTPYELKYICYVLDLSKKQYYQLHNLLRAEI